MMSEDHHQHSGRIFKHFVFGVCVSFECVRELVSRYCMGLGLWFKV
jgi:hypothetical protein